MIDPIKGFTCYLVGNEMKTDYVILFRSRRFEDGKM
jgi:hypothetical protein